MERLNAESGYGPWPDVATARLFLGGLVRGELPVSAVAQWRVDLKVIVLADWLIRGEIGGLVLGRYGEGWPELGQVLREDQYVALAEWGLHTQTLGQLAEAFQTAEITAVLLKGAALALTVYPQRAWRTMSDIDVWVQKEEMKGAVAVLTELGFAVHEKVDRPLLLQRLSQGEIQLYRTDWAQGLVELHWSPFQGWWLQRVAKIKVKGVWERKEALSFGETGSIFYQLAPEDMVLQVILHQVVGSHLSAKPVQGLLDLALTAHVRGVDWSVVAERAQVWRVGNAVWLVLHLLDQLIETPGVETALERLRPSRFRRRLLQRLISAEKVLAGIDIRGGKPRYLLLLFLVDRIRDMAYLIFRTLWPEREWLQARYPERGSRGHHLWQVVRYGRI